MRIFFLLPLLLVSLLRAQVFTGVSYHAGYFPDKVLPGLVTDYTQDRPWLSKPMDGRNVFTGYSVRIGFKAPLGFWLGGNFSWSSANHKRKGVEPVQNQDAKYELRFLYRTSGIVLSHALLGSNDSRVSLHAEATLDYGHFMSKARTRPSDNDWAKYDRDANGTWSTRLSPVVRIKSKENDGAYYEIRPFYVYAFRDNFSFSETGNALIQTPAHAPYVQNLSHFGIGFSFFNILGGGEAPTKSPREQKG